MNQQHQLAPEPQYRRIVPAALRAWGGRIRNTNPTLFPEAYRWEAAQVVGHLATAIDDADLEGVCVRSHARWTLAALAVADIVMLDDAGALEFIRTSKAHLAAAIQEQAVAVAYFKAERLQCVKEMRAEA